MRRERAHIRVATHHPGSVFRMLLRRPRTMAGARRIVAQAIRDGAAWLVVYAQVRGDRTRRWRWERGEGWARTNMDGDEIPGRRQP